MRRHEKGFFWLSYSDLMTSLFFIMLVLFIVCLVKASMNYRELMLEKKKVEGILGDVLATNEQLRQIIKLRDQFKELSNSSVLGYNDEKKMFYAKDFVGIEIFEPYNGTNIDRATTILDKYTDKVLIVGKELERILYQLSKNSSNFSYQLIIEGTAAIPWKEKISGSYNPDNYIMYNLSYRRALAVYNLWKANKIDLRKYNTEIIIAGSGFNGINRDEKVEDNNKRFIIQIIPKVSRPQPEEN